MLLAIDVGNTNIVLGIFEDDRLVESWRLDTCYDQTVDETQAIVNRLFVERGIDRTRVKGVVIASVVPLLDKALADVTKRCFNQEPLMVEPVTVTGMPILCDSPDEVGADRVVGGVAAFEFYGRPNVRPVIVVDFGTATTFDAISVDGEYMGGLICPGIQTSSDALSQHAMKLPRVELRKPPSLIGRTTVESMQAGLFYGYLALVEGVIERMQAELKPSTSSDIRAICVATGGLASIIAPETSVIDQINFDLTLQGLRLVWERNVVN